MYSRSMREGREPTALPPRYSGVRFRNERRADGRDIAIEAPLPAPARPEAPSAPPENKKCDRLAELLSGIGGDDLLLAALIIILAGEGEDSREAVLLLLLLLCIRK